MYIILSVSQLAELILKNSSSHGVISLGIVNLKRNINNTVQYPERFTEIRLIHGYCYILMNDKKDLKQKLLDKRFVSLEE